ncbi:MAG: Rpn family recombination-promoting nuclease/putative transposase [Spirulina sp. SIO3F2]|nr:Rpn family recombination-promoting nuclease/putative transposase [Spirulina sp. SIO3F2]
MYDNFCKYLIETYPDDFVAWLIGKPVALTRLEPTELISDPIRADSLLLQGQDVVLHVEFQTQPDKQIPERMANYYLRIRKKFATQHIVQVVVYLRATDSPLVQENVFQSGGMTHRFEVIRLWEQPKAVFWDAPGLLPFAILSKAANEDAAALLEQMRVRINEVTPDVAMQGNLAMATAVLAGLKLSPVVIQEVMRSKAMRESLFYQEILREGRAEGRQEGRQEGRVEGRQEGRLMMLRQVVQILQGWGFPVERLLKIVGITMAELEQVELSHEDEASS